MNKAKFKKILKTISTLAFMGSYEGNAQLMDAVAYIEALKTCVASATRSRRVRIAFAPRFYRDFTAFALYRYLSRAYM